MSADYQPALQGASPHDVERAWHQLVRALLLGQWPRRRDWPRDDDGRPGYDGSVIGRPSSDSERRPPLVIVTGAPAAGKTTLARLLARELGLPLIAKDTVKEALMDALGVESLERSVELGGASFGVVFAVAAELVDLGGGLVLEGNFRDDLSRPHLAPLIDRTAAVVIVCWAPRAVLLERYRARATARHPGHRDLERTDAVDADRHSLELGVPTLRVDTSAGPDPDAILHWTREGLKAWRKRGCT